MRKPTTILLLLFVACLPSCAYLGDRALDALDPYDIAVGIGTGGGVRGRALGLVDTGLLFGVKPQATSLGWKYGRPFLLQPGPLLEADQSWVVMATSFEAWDFAADEFKLSRRSFFLLPFALSWVDTSRRDEPRWYVSEEGSEFLGDDHLWSAETLNHNRYAMVHAWDVEVEIAIVAFLEVGFSPGEAIDFWLGLLTIDIAGDDGRSRR